jgi:hypothetical protein
MLALTGCTGSATSTTSITNANSPGNQPATGTAPLRSGTLTPSATNITQPSEKKIATNSTPSPATGTAPTPKATIPAINLTITPVVIKDPFVLESVPTVPNIEGPPIILILTPSASSVIPTGDVTVTTLVTNFNLVKPVGQANAAGEGHIIYYLDAVPPRIPGKAATTDMGTYAEATTTTFTWRNVSAGYHFISVQLVNNDNTPLVPAIINTIYVIAR